MKQWIFTCIAGLFLAACSSHNEDTQVKDAKDFQQNMVNEYNDTAYSPIPAAERLSFKGIHFFPISKDYIVTAHFTRTANELAFQLPMSGKDVQQYVKYGNATFTLLGKEYTLGVYQSVRLAQSEENKNYLAIFFKDQTSGNDTYGGGRYIDLRIPGSDTLTINFNKAYHPYCAYTEGYSCPIPPKENYLPVRVEAGVRF